MEATNSNNKRTAVHAYLAGNRPGRVYVDRNRAMVRYDAGLGLRSRAHWVDVSLIDFSREWKQLRTLSS